MCKSCGHPCALSQPASEHTQSCPPNALPAYLAILLQRSRLLSLALLDLNERCQRGEVLPGVPDSFGCVQLPLTLEQHVHHAPRVHVYTHIEQGGRKVPGKIFSAPAVPGEKNVLVLSSSSSAAVVKSRLSCDACCLA